jgi:ankyrin repeat protein
MREQRAMHHLLDHNLISILQVDYVKYMALRSACLAGFTEIVTRLLESGVHPNPPCDDYPLFLSYLPYIARDSRKDIVMMLLSAGVDLGRYDFYQVGDIFCGWTPENFDIPRALVRHGLDIHMVNAQSDNQLHRAVKRPIPMSVIALLLDEGVGINHRNVKGHTPLTDGIATASEDIYDTPRSEKRTIVELLLQRGARTDLPDNESWHPLHHAADYAQPWAVRLLSQYGADIEARTADGATPLHLACQSDRQSARVIEALLDAGADPTAEATTEWGDAFTPIHIALGKRDYIGLRYLYDRWMAMFPALPSSEMILLAAAALGDVAVLQTLIDRKTVNIEGDGERTTALMTAAAAGQDEAIKLLLRHVRDVDMSDREGNTALQLAVRFATETTIQLLLPRSSMAWAYHRSREMLIAYAIMHQPPEVLRTLLEWRRQQHPQHGIDWKEVLECLSHTRLDVDIADKARIMFEYMEPADLQPREENVPLIFFIEKGCIDIALEIIQRGIGLEARVRHETPLGVAARRGELAVVRALVNAGVDLETRLDTDGTTALAAAVLGSHSQVIQYLLAAEANSGVSNDNRVWRSVFLSAVRQGQVDLIRSLLAANMDLNTGNALYWANHEGLERIAAILVDAGAPVDEIDRDGRTILSQAACRGRTAIVRILLDKGVRVNLPDRHGRTPFLMAACRGHCRIASLLLEKGADMHHKDYFGRSALSLAADQGHVEMVRWLIEQGANINEGDRTGRTPLSWAMQMDAAEAVEALVLAGCDVLKPDHYGRTPLHWAASDGCIAKLYSLPCRI